MCGRSGPSDVLDQIRVMDSGRCLLVFFPDLDQNWASSRPDADSFMVIWPKYGQDLVQYHAGSGPAHFVYTYI